MFRADGDMAGQGSCSGGSMAGCDLQESRNGYSPAPNSTTTSQTSHHNRRGLVVFSWGRGEDGQLGLGDTSDQHEPTFLDALRGVAVRQLACGSGHTCILSQDGEVYTWGRGDDGRLGVSGQFSERLEQWRVNGVRDDDTPMCAGAR